MAILLAVGVACLLAVSSLLQQGATQAVSGTDAHGYALLGAVLGYLGAAVLGNVLVHRAYRLAPLRYSLPALTAVQPVSALVIALLVLQEHESAGALGPATTFAGIALVVVGSFVASGTEEADEANVPNRRLRFFPQGSGQQLAVALRFDRSVSGICY